MPESPKQTVVIADPDSDFLEWASRHLRADSISIETCNHADEALKLFLDKNADLLLTELHLKPFDGLELLKKGIDIPYFSECHKNPAPEVEKGMVFSQYVNSMIDISDGLLIDLERVLTRSEKGAVIRYGDIPVTEEMHSVCSELKLDEIELVLSGGEDFALLFTISPDKEREMKGTGVSFHIIGEVKEEKGIKIESGGNVIRQESTGFDHFKQGY